MAFKVIVSPVAKANIKDGVGYYKRKASVKVAQNFIFDYKQTLKKIVLNPYYQIYYKDVRGIPMKKYPYLIFFRVVPEQNFILIDAVFQANQDTEKRP